MDAAVVSAELFHVVGTELTMVVSAKFIFVMSMQLIRKWNTMKFFVVLVNWLIIGNASFDVVSVSAVSTSHALV